jgi:hypothetical protein
MLNSPRTLQKLLAVHVSVLTSIVKRWSESSVGEKFAMTDEQARQAAVDEFFEKRPGWSTFNYEPCFLRGWDSWMTGSKDQSGGYLAHTTERVCYNAGQSAADRHLYKTGRTE